MPALAPNDDLFTLVNVFTVSADRQQELVALLVEATEQTMQHLPGFVSANIHASHDGTRVINYAQWQSREHFEAMREREAVQPHTQRAAEVAENYDPIFCDLVDSTPQPS
jgi:quinol monooxygenase YgiN